MKFTQAVVSTVFASCTMAAPAAVIERRDSTATVFGTISNAVTQLQAVAGTAQNSITASAKSLQDAVVLKVDYAAIAKAFTGATTTIAGSATAGIASLKTSASSLTQAEVDQLTGTLNTAKTTIAALGGTITSANASLKPAVTTLITNEVATAKSVVTVAATPLLTFSAAVQKFASAGLNTAALKTASAGLLSTVQAQVKILGLPAYSGPPATTAA